MINLLRTLKGSRVYGTDVEGSDHDYFSLFRYPFDTYFELNYERQINTSDDDVSMEIGRYLHLLMKGSPVQVETLFTPRKYMTDVDPIMESLFEVKDIFLTKKLKNSYTGFIHSQLHKAKNITHRLDWEQNEVERKTIFDFCHVSLGAGGSIKVLDYLTNLGIKTENIGLTHMPNMADCYGMYHDNRTGIYKGMADEDSNSLRLDSIPKDMVKHYLGLMHFNNNAYSSHCKVYREYTDWLAKRNPDRYKAIKDTGSIVDLKFFYHTIRLLNTTKEIFRDKQLIVDRRDIDAEFLKSIRRGEIPLEELNKLAEDGLAEINELYEKSDLPDEVDYNTVNELAVKLRQGVINEWE